MGWDVVVFKGVVEDDGDVVVDVEVVGCFFGGGDDCFKSFKRGGDGGVEVFLGKGFGCWGKDGYFEGGFWWWRVGFGGERGGVCVEDGEGVGEVFYVGGEEGVG